MNIWNKAMQRLGIISRTLCLLLIGAIFCGANAMAGSWLESYWPLHGGDTKTFAYGAKTLTIAITDNGGGQFHADMESEDDSAYEEYQVNADSIRISEVGEGWISVWLDPYVNLFTDSVLQNGGTLVTKTSATQRYAGTYPATFTVTVKKVGTVTIPAGTFEDCRSITVKETATVPGQGTVSASAMTAILAPQVGMIKKLVAPGTWAVLVSGTVGGVDVTKAVPWIKTQPANQTVVAGKTATFAVVATGKPAPTFTWQWCLGGGSTWVAIPGAISSSYTIPAAAFSDNGKRFRCVVSNGVGTPATSQEATLTVNKISAKVKIAGLKQVYNGQPRPVTVTTVPTGLSVSISYGGIADVPVHAGTYVVRATITDNNATGAMDGMLVIAKAGQTIFFPKLASKTLGDPDFAPDAMASSGFTLVYTTSNPSVAQCTNGLIHIIGAGTATITASQLGNADYNAAKSVKQTLTVKAAVATAVAKGAGAVACLDTKGEAGTGEMVVRLLDLVRPSQVVNGEVANVVVAGGTAQVLPTSLAMASGTPCSFVLECYGVDANHDGIPDAVAAALGDCPQEGVKLLTIQYEDGTLIATTPFEDILVVEGVPLPLDALPAAWRLVPGKR